MNTLLGTIIAILIGIWLLRAVFQVLLGLGELFVALLCGIYGVTLLALAGLLGIFEKLWQAATAK